MFPNNNQINHYQRPPNNYNPYQLNQQEFKYSSNQHFNQHSNYNIVYVQKVFMQRHEKRQQFPEFYHVGVNTENQMWRQEQSNEQETQRKYWNSHEIDNVNMEDSSEPPSFFESNSQLISYQTNFQSQPKCSCTGKCCYRCFCKRNGKSCNANCGCDKTCTNQKTNSELSKHIKTTFKQGCQCKNGGCTSKTCACHKFGRKCDKKCKCNTCYNSKSHDGNDSVIISNNPVKMSTFTFSGPQ